MCFFQGLTITDLEDLLEDIKVYLELEQGKNTEYWRDIVTVTTDELTKLRKQESTSKGMNCCCCVGVLRSFVTYRIRSYTA